MKLLISILLLISVKTAWGSDAETLSLVSGDFYPLAGENLPDGGLATSIVTKACALVGYKTKITYMPWARGYQEAMHLRFAATFPYTHTADRERDFLFSKPLYNFRISVFVNAQSKIKFETLDDLKGLRLALPLGYAMFSLAPMVERKEISIVRTQDMIAAFKMIEYNRSDIVVVMDTVGWPQIEKIYGNRRGFRTLDKALDVASDHFIVSKTQPKGQEIIHRFNEGLDSLKKSGEWDRLIRRLGEAYYDELSHKP